MADLVNLRDIGGRAGRDGRTVRGGVVYRSCSLDRMDPGDSRLAALGLKTVVDLRSAVELDGAACIPQGASREWIPLVANEDVAASLPSTDRPSELLAAVVRSTESPRVSKRAVRLALAMHTSDTQLRINVESLVYMREPLRRLFSLLGDERRLPLLYHCLAGKDRTGVVTAVLLSLLGVSHDDIVADYCATNRTFAEGELAKYLARHGVERTADHDELLPVFGVPATGLDRLLSALHGDSAEAVLVDRVGLPKKTMERVIETLLD